MHRQAADFLLNGLAAVFNQFGQIFGAVEQLRVLGIDDIEVKAQGFALALNIAPLHQGGHLLQQCGFGGGRKLH